MDTPVERAFAADLGSRGRLLLAGRVLLAAVLLATAIGKLLDIGGFAAVVATYRALPEPVVLPAALALALGELGLGLWLLSGMLLVPAALASVLLHAVYLAWSAAALARGLDIPNCGCFGVFWARPLSWLTLAEDGVMLLVSLALYRGARRRAAEGGGEGRSSGTLHAAAS
jgi:uncharacterized membrane protein YphA (DoxX/SURF4 family)